MLVLYVGQYDINDIEMKKKNIHTSINIVSWPNACWNCVSFQHLPSSSTAMCVFVKKNDIMNRCRVAAGSSKYRCTRVD